MTGLMIQSRTCQADAQKVVPSSFLGGITSICVGLAILSFVVSCSDHPNGNQTPANAAPQRASFKNRRLEFFISIKPLDAATLRQAVKTLREARIFEWGIGLSSNPGGQNDNEKAMSAILGATNALVLFEIILTNATPAGQLYAFCGIHKLNPARFRQLAPSFAKTNVTVTTRYACLGISGVRLSSILADIAGGQFDREIEPGPWRWCKGGNPDQGWTYAPLNPALTTNKSP